MRQRAPKKSPEVRAWLTAALKDAKAAATTAAALCRHDDGPRNLHTPAIRLPNAFTGDLLASARAAGVEVSELLTGRLHGYRFVFLFVPGKSARRCAAAAAAVASLQAAFAAGPVAGAEVQNWNSLDA